MKEDFGISEKLNIEDEYEPPFELEVKMDECDFDENDPEKDLVNDYVFIRKKLRYSVAACETVLQSALRDMATNPGARSVEGCSAIIKTITECTSQLLGLHEKRKKIFLIKSDDKKEEEIDENGKTKIKARIDQIIDSFNEEEEED